MNAISTLVETVDNYFDNSTLKIPIQFLQKY